MAKHKLKQNEDVIYIYNMYKAGFSFTHSLRPWEIDGMIILPADNVKSLGAMWSDTAQLSLTLDKHASAVCSAASLHIRNIGKIRHLLTQSIVGKMV